jgi:hypothetical protein
MYSVRRAVGSGVGTGVGDVVVGVGGNGVDDGFGVVRAGVGAGTDVGASVAAGVATGTGVSVGVGVGACVATGVGSAVGAAVGSGVGVGLVVLVSSKTVEAMISEPPLVPPVVARNPDATDTAASAWEPTLPAGTLIVILNPRPLTVAEGKPADAPSHVSWIWVLFGKLRPAIATKLPAAPLEGDVEIAGDPASVVANGSAIASRTTTIVVVAAQSRQGVRLGGGAASTPRTQPVPSQKDM